MSDTTEPYIKMADCPEIQQERPSPPYWVHAHGGGSPSYWLGGLWMRPDPIGKPEHYLWLPTQAQLQEMLDYRYPISAGKNLGRWLDNLHAEDYLQKTEWSMEQLWLAFVMKEKHGKVWTGTEWKEDTDGRKEGLHS